MVMKGFGFKKVKEIVNILEIRNRDKFFVIY